jgi:hypothetical protein
LQVNISSLQENQGQEYVAAEDEKASKEDLYQSRKAIRSKYSSRINDGLAEISSLRQQRQVLLQSSR